MDVTRACWWRRRESNPRWAYLDLVPAWLRPLAKPPDRVELQQRFPVLGSTNVLLDRDQVLQTDHSQLQLPDALGLGPVGDRVIVAQGFEVAQQVQVPDARRQGEARAQRERSGVDRERQVRRRPAKPDFQLA